MARKYRCFLIGITIIGLLPFTSWLFTTYSNPRTFQSNQSDRATFCKDTLNWFGIQNVLDFIKNEMENKKLQLNSENDLLQNLLWCAKNSGIKAAVSSSGKLSMQNSVPVNKSEDLVVDKNRNSSGADNSTFTNSNIESELLRLPIINRHEFPYILNQPDACKKNNIKFIIAVPSAPDYFEQRQRVRKEEGGSFTSDPKNRAKLLFFLGKFNPLAENSLSVQKEIEKEEHYYKDIVQVDFIEHYRNWTKKASLLLRWSISHCPKSTFIIRMDDDIRVDLNKITQAMEEFSRDRTKNPHFILGNLQQDWGPIRDKESKYYLSFEEYPHPKLPPFLLGGTMGYPVDTARLLFEAYQRLKILFLDDVFITSNCALKAGVSIYNSSAFRFVHCHGPRSHKICPPLR